MACPRYFQSARFGRAGASHPSLPLKCYLLWSSIKLLSSELLFPASSRVISKSSSTQGTLEVGKGGLPPLLSKRAIRKSGGKPPFPTSNMLPSLVFHKALEFGTLIPSLKSSHLEIELNTRNIRGREGWLAPATFKARDSKSGGKPPFPTSNILLLSFPIKLLSSELLPLICYLLSPSISS